MKRIVAIVLILILSAMGCQSTGRMPSGTVLKERQSLLVAWNPFENKKSVHDIWQAVIDHCTYKSDGDEDIWQSPKTTYNTKHGDCEDINLLFASALLAEGYDAYIAVGSTTTPERWINHAWVLLKQNGKEYYLDATWPAAPLDLEICLTKKFEWYVRYTIAPQRQAKVPATRP